jgi:hypothetical protein
MFDASKRKIAAQDQLQLQSYELGRHAKLVKRRGNQEKGGRCQIEPLASP